MINFLAAGIGGFLGAVARYGIYILTAGRAALGSAWATFAVNVAGCFLIGVLAGCDFKNLEHLKLFLITGVLGGFTTFSAFGLDSFIFLKNGEILKAFIYSSGTLFCGILSVWCGFTLIKLMR